jgi:predicted acyltransferase
MRFSIVFDADVRTRSTISAMNSEFTQSSRLTSLDQFRGYTVAGMFLVNFVGSFEAIKASLPILKHHHTYCSYADTIMPQFFFAVGFAYRLTFLRRREKLGEQSAYWHVVTRSLGLLLVALIIHRLDGQYDSWSKLQEVGLWGVVSTAFQRNFFQTLTHIAVTSLWVMPVIAARPMWRIAYAIFSAVLFHALSEWWYYDWVMQRPGIDGGPLGFLTWTIPLIAGTLAYDWVAAAKSPPIVRLMFAGIVVMAIGYGLSCVNLLTPPNDVPVSSDWKSILNEPPFVPPSRPVNIWTMTQRGGSVSYLTFGAGFSFAIYALFVLACDIGKMQIGVFRTLGTNALVGYILHSLVNQTIKPFIPKDSPLWYVMSGFAVSFAICYLVLRHLEKQRIFLRL